MKTYLLLMKNLCTNLLENTIQKVLLMKKSQIIKYHLLHSDGEAYSHSVNLNCANDLDKTAQAYDEI